MERRARFVIDGQRVVARQVVTLTRTGRRPVFLTVIVAAGDDPAPYERMAAELQRTLQLIL